MICRVCSVNTASRTRDAHRHPPADWFHVEFIFLTATTSDFEFHKFFGLNLEQLLAAILRRRKIVSTTIDNSLLLWRNSFYFAHRKWL